MAWKPLPLLSEQNNATVVTAVMFGAAITLVHDCLKINRLCGHWDYFGQDEKASVILNRLLSIGKGAIYSLSNGFWQSFVTIGSRNHLMRIISTYVGNTKKSEIS